jgi:hypothetical protein
MGLDQEKELERQKESPDTVFLNNTKGKTSGR